MFLRNLNAVEAVNLTTSGQSAEDFLVVEVDGLHLDPVVMQNQFAEVALPSPDGGSKHFILFNVTVPLPIKKSVFFKKTLITPDSVSDGLTTSCPVAPKVTLLVKKDDIKNGIRMMTTTAETLPSDDDTMDTESKVQ